MDVDAAAVDDAAGRELRPDHDHRLNPEAAPRDPLHVVAEGGGVGEGARAQPLEVRLVLAVVPALHDRLVAAHGHDPAGAHALQNDHAAAPNGDVVKGGVQT